MTQCDGNLPLSQRHRLYWKYAPPSPEEVRLKHRIDEVYTQYPFMGSRRIAVMLHQEGVTVHRNTVQSYMRDMGLSAIYPGPNFDFLCHHNGMKVLVI